MISIKNKLRRSLFIAYLFLLSNCVPDKSFETPNTLCVETMDVNITIEELKNRYLDDVFQIQEDLVLKAVVISSDKEGNFFSVLHCQDAYENPEHGMQIEIGLQDSHLFYAPGSIIFIKLKGLYLGKSNDIYKIGGVFTSFGNITVGRLPALSVKQHLFLSCEEQQELQPSLVIIPEINDSQLNTLVTIENVEFSQDVLGFLFAEIEEETERSIVDCDAYEIALLNSGYSNFQSQIIPSFSGDITGVLTKDSNDYQLVIRSLEDIRFTEERCEELIDEFTSTSIFISELADPDNNSSARYVELYNAGESSLSLKGWKLQRYTNNNTVVSSEIDLTAQVIEGKSTIVLASNTEDFNSIYGFLPSLDAGSNSPADSNGDDNLVLVDPFGTTIDIFGVLGEDGSGTNHEFEDGRALRKPTILNGNPIYTFSEWEITNDTGASGTSNDPQIAPEDFTPGRHNE